ncbi:LIM domain protein [Aspergillus melleus]|uniref:LIM domain protein n=1 Tax=Aspergillus melleus TaxID=138277 RepID=UPI001E8D50C6|nr:uncharacterized protein LDX57_000418 [Aspergillus melleus]KAH8422664.1 hypothetical protein LDX57_000418 [Aspergillus melleus]
MHRSYLPHAKAKDGQRKVSPSGPSYMSNDQIANYLKDLRTNRPARPSGSRPLPTKTPSSGSRDDLPPRAASAMSTYSNSARSPTKPAADVDPPRATSSLSNHRPFSPRGSLYGSPGRSVQEPRTIPVRQNISPTRVHSRFSPPSPGMYRESNQRRFEREQARSLRNALEEMNVHEEEDEETRIQRAAQDEATELVWMHQNPGMASKNPYAPYRNPDVDRFRGSPSKINPPAQPSGPSSPRRNGLFRSSVSETPSASAGSKGLSGSPTRDTQQERTGSDETTSPRKYGSLRKSLRVNFSMPREQQSPSKSRDGACGLGLTNVASDSNRGIFRNPNDHIYEEPTGSPPKEGDERPDFSRSDSSALRSKPRNALPRGSRPLPGRLGSIPFVDKLSRFELHKHPPTQSRNAEYKTNDPTPKSKPEEEVFEEPSPATKDGLEIRSDDIRAATSKKLKDRSSKLPMPTAVSDRTGRPIVSFEPAWKPTEAQSPPKPEPAAPTRPVVPAAPTIEVSEPPAIPVINVPDEREPTISEMGGGSAQAASNQPRARPSPPKSGQSSSSSPRKPARALQDRWLSAYTRSGVPTAKCESCSLPIAGRIVTAAGTRFHPECFVCFHCQTALECVAFYQEPEAKRYERLADASAYDEEARTLRFYCHLDFHEIFSPRCKSCKTPIEGEVVVACGAEWHVGHFFCAECGDPFDQDTPFVEKDGFAWCLQCHSRRTAPRCLGCKKPVLDDVVITAVGGQWHDECFNCHECGSGLGTDGRYFVREGEPKRTAKGRIIGGPVQLAVCERCEGIRLKATP